MSFLLSNEDKGKKACHVKWAGKTIALGTFPPGEAEEKCARAKALTRAWRSTMRPKPSREWVMMELERLGVRVVSGGRTATRKEGDKESEEVAQQGASDFDSLMQRRASSVGLSLDSDQMRRSSSLGLGQSMGLEDVIAPPHRPLVGGASAAAYEAARADHYSNLAAKKGLGGDVTRRVSNLSSAGLSSQSALSVGMAGMTGNTPNQHYEMLKLHHMNLLNEIQETTLMMNLYQQQQLQQQQKQQQQQQHQRQQDVGLDSQGMMASLKQQSIRGSELGSVYGAGSGFGSALQGMGGMDAMGSHRAGLTGTFAGMDAMGSLRSSSLEAMGSSRTSSLETGVANGGPASANQLLDEQKSVEERLNQIKEEIARRQQEADELEAAARAQEDAGGKPRKKRKTGKRD